MLAIPAWRKWFATAASSVIFLSLSAPGQGTEESYPAPRYPDLKKLSQRDLVEIARVVVRRPSAREGKQPGYGVRAGEKVLIVVNNNFERRVLEAIATAIREEGATVDAMITHAPPRRAAAGGWEEIAPYVVEQGPGRRSRATKDYAIQLATLGDYDLLIYGSAGMADPTPFRWEMIHWNTLEKFITGHPDFPWQVAELIEQKIWDIVKSARRIRLTDPEGTDLSWSMKPEYFDQLKEHHPGWDIVQKGHLGLTPLQFTPVGHDATGVVASTVNHAGVFPRMKIHLENAHIQRIEAGGRLGELWNQFLTHHKDANVPGFPGPGGGWFQEATLGTNPKAIRSAGVLINERPSFERLAAGVMHLGFGLTTKEYWTGRAAYDEYMRDNPQFSDGHFHVHLYFPTVEVTTHDGKTIILVDKGHITVLDDPEVRAVASRFGDPDQILRRAWIPGIPGINVPGDYESDYAPDASHHIKEELHKYYGEFVPQAP